MVTKLIDFISSEDDETAQNSIYALGNMASNESIASIAEKAGVIDALLGAVDRCMHLVQETLDKILELSILFMSHLLDPSAKYWQKNTLSDRNLIVDGFYDIGYAGNNLRKMKRFLKIEQLQSNPIGKEIVVIDFKSDANLLGCLLAAQHKVNNLAPVQQIQVIAEIVSHVFGGSQKSSNLSKSFWKTELSALRKATGSDLLPIGQVKNGSFQLRALLFKALCDRMMIYPCSLHRGQEGSAWNVIDLEQLTGCQAKENGSTLPKAHWNRANTRMQQIMKLPFKQYDKMDVLEGTAVIDLVFEPGELLTGQRAEAYKSKIYSQ